jgi:hypothetical protein
VKALFAQGFPRELGVLRDESFLCALCVLCNKGFLMQRSRKFRERRP